MKKVARCNCGQLSINTISQPEAGQHGFSDSNFTCYHTDSIDRTHGDAHCVTRHNEDNTINFYRCAECFTELFAVPQSNPSIVAVLSRYFSKDPAPQSETALENRSLEYRRTTSGFNEDYSHP